MAIPTLEQTVLAQRDYWAKVSREQQQREIDNNIAVAKAYDLLDEVPTHVPLERVSLTRNSAFRWPNKTPEERDALFVEEAIKELISYAVGCMFGRYSLDAPGLILADQGDTVADYERKVAEKRAELGDEAYPAAGFKPDADNVIPVVDGEWFSDDIVARFRQFLRAAFGDEHFEANLRYIEKTLGKTLRQYFVKDFYKDHLSRYSNRPIYWMYSSDVSPSKGAFNALMYLHRYTPATLNVVLNEYLREYENKLRAEINSLEKSGTGANLKKADALRKQLTECEDYERDVLFPLASRNLAMDLDDGVLVNYLRFGKALAKVDAIEKKRKDVETWTWPVNPLRPEDA